MKNNFIGEGVDQLGARKFCDAKDDWVSVSKRIPYLPNVYSVSWIRDYQAYHQGCGQSLSDLSLVLYHDNAPCGIWPLTIVSKVNNPLRMVADKIAPPLLVSDLNPRTIKSINKSCISFIENMVLSSGGNYWESAESFTDRSGISEWQNQALLTGAKSTLSYELYIDLSLNLDRLRQYFRKSYKSLINSGLRHWETHIMDTPQEGAWEEYRELHHKVSGRVTRSIETWELQLQSIKEGHAFLVYLRQPDGRMVGGGYFNTTQNEATYSVGVYDRSLFRKPLGHVVQIKAIEEMKERDLAWYRIGNRPYSSDEEAPTDKQLTVGDFKQGFASHIFPKFVLKHNLSNL